MEIVTIEAFFLNYSTQTVIIAVLSAMLALLLKIILKEKFTGLTKVYLLVLTATILHVLYDMFFISKGVSINGETLYAGLISGTFAIGISSFILRLSKGTPTSNMDFLLVDGIINEIISEDVKDTVIRKILIISDSKIEHIEKSNEISKAILDNAIISLTEDDATSLAKEILKVLGIL